VNVSVTRAVGARSTRCSSRSTHAGGQPPLSRGRHRLQGRYPASSASRTVAKYSTLRAWGFFAVHVGRQKIPVVLTPTTKMPS
jgi:hypothetical protein